MKRFWSRFIIVVGAFLAIAAAALWAAFWWRWVAREYERTPTGSQNLEHAILNEIGGTLFVGFSVFWLFRRWTSALGHNPVPSVSPVDVVRCVVSDLTIGIRPTSNWIIALCMLRSRVTTFVAKALSLKQKS